MNLAGLIKPLYFALLSTLLLSHCVSIIIETGHLDSGDLAAVVADAENLAT